MKKVQSKKLLRVLVAVCALAMLICSLATASLAATSTEWVTNAGRESLVNKISNTEFSIIGPKAAPTEFFSYDPATTNVNTGISTTDVSFNIKIDGGAEAHGDFYGLFALRIANPSVGVWGGNTALSVQFNKGQVILRRWSGGMIDAEKEIAIAYEVVDGAVHAVNIKIEEYTVTVTVDDQVLTMTYDYFPGAGGYQFMAYNSTVHITDFEDGTTASGPVDPQPTDPTEPVEPKPTEPVEPKPTEPVEPKPTEPQPTKPVSGTPGGTQPANDGGNLYIIIGGAVVGLCVVIAVVYFVASKKKK